MPVIRQPIACKHHRDSRRTDLWFETQDGKAIREFYMMASVCWPEGEQDGYALLGGQDQDDGRVMIFREFPFLTVEHWLNPDNSLQQHGIILFLAQIWTQFQCRQIAWAQDKEIHRRYSLEVYHCPMIEPKPEFIPVLYTDPKAGDTLIEEYVARELLQGDGNLRLAKDLGAYRAQAIDNSSVHALRCMLGGIAYNPAPPKPRGPRLIDLPWTKRNW